ncbi:hypothetical protein NDU88_005517 [Pleurodeles waltl]|uniref:Uncharacterized protein n=1 Tax=Pleurodeles waltl TaxID=8319 RepID=A0AAV7WYS1_PLEWA|nr:hypothetical protein NDU88_005517 [Pleurodeles waltl]
MGSDGWTAGPTGVSAGGPVAWVSGWGEKAASISNPGGPRSKAPWEGTRLRQRMESEVGGGPPALKTETGGSAAGALGRAWASEVRYPRGSIGGDDGAMGPVGR